MRPGPELVGLDADEVERFWHAFESSCGSLLTREDTSGLTRPEDWRTACAFDRGNSAGGARNAVREHQLLVAQEAGGPVCSRR